MLRGIPNLPSARTIGNVKKQFSPPVANSVLYIPMYPPLVSPTPDWSGNNNDGTIFGATWKRLGSGLWYLDFDGADDIVNCGTDASLDITDVITIKAWVNPRSLGENNFGRLVDTHDTNPFRVMMNGDILFEFRLQDDTPAYHATSTNAGSVPLNIWTHFVGTYDGTTQKTYINKVLQADTEIFSESLIALGALDLIVGNRNGGDRTWDGGIALFEITHEAWSATQITNSYSQERHLFGV